MSKEELLKYLIAEIDLIMHDKDYRFENANGTWYSRESCRDLTNEEVFEELRTELRQFADLEAKFAESEKKNFELVAKINLKEHKPAFCILADRDCDALGQVEELQKQLSEKDKAIANWQTIYESVVQTCHNDKEEIERLNKILATQEKTITNLVEDNRASQEWYRKQLEEKDKEIEYQENMKILAVENQNKKVIEQLEKVRDYFVEEDVDGDGLKTCDWTITKDACDVAEFIDQQINELKGKVE